MTDQEYDLLERARQIAIHHQRFVVVLNRAGKIGFYITRRNKIEHRCADLDEVMAHLRELGI